MVDNMNPNSQFHPYQPVTDTPAAERQQGGLAGMLSKLGMGNVNTGNLNVSDSLGKMREFARAKPGLVLGGLAALAIGAGMMRRRT